MYMSQTAKSVTMLIRGPSLEAGMSQYLVDRILKTPNITVRTCTEVVDTVAEDGHLSGLVLLDKRTGETETVTCDRMCCFIGATPRTDWLEEAGIARDDHGFILSGPDLRDKVRMDAGSSAAPPGNKCARCVCCRRRAFGVRQAGCGRRRRRVDGSDVGAQVSGGSLMPRGRPMGSQNGEECVRDELRHPVPVRGPVRRPARHSVRGRPHRDLPRGPDRPGGRTRHLLLRDDRRRADHVEALRRRRHPDQPHVAARRVLRRVVGLHPRRGAGLPGVGAADQAVAVLRAGLQRRSPGSCRRSSRWPSTCSRATWSAARRQSQIIGQREKLLALGTITAGLTHQLNNPAAATARAVADLREGVGQMRHKLAMLAEGKFTPEALRVLVSIQDEVAEQVAKTREHRTVRARGLRSRGPDRRLAGGPRHRRRLGLRADVRRGRPGHRLAGAGARRWSTMSTPPRRCRARSGG